MYNTFERINGSLATEDRIIKKLKLASTLKIKHRWLQPRNSLDLETRWLRKMFAVIRNHFESCTQGRWGMETACYLPCRKKSDLSGTNGTCAVYLDQCDAGIPTSDGREASTISFALVSGERHVL